MFIADSDATSIFKSVEEHGFILSLNRVKSILNHAEVKIIISRYWHSEHFNDEAAFIIYPQYSCKTCRNGSFSCSSRRQYISHLMDCMAKRKLIRRILTIRTYERLRVLPKPLLNALHQAEIVRDNGAVCIAPVSDHYDVVRFAAKQKKIMRESRNGINGEVNGFDRGERRSIDSIRPCVLPQGQSMPLDRRVWIETPLSSDLATMFLRGLKARRHSDTLIQFPLYDPQGEEHASHLDIRHLPKPIHFPNATAAHVNDKIN